MNRLMKAESYRLLRSGGVFKWLVILSAFAALLPSLASMGADNGISKYMVDFSEMGMMSILMIMPIGAAALLILSYNNKTLYYEVMEGNKISHILGSKLICITAYLSIIQMGFILMVIAWEYIDGNKNLSDGIGSLSQLPLRIVLIYIMIIHVVSTGVLITTSFRNAVGVAVVFIRFYIFDTICLTVLYALDGVGEKRSLIEHISKLFMSGQLGALANDKINTWTVGCVICTCLVEGLIWYIISYIGYKKKKFQ